MNDHDDFQPASSNPVQQRGIDALRQNNGQAGVDPQTFEMRDLDQIGNQPGQFVITQYQRIAAAENHFINAGIVRQLRKSLRPLTRQGVAVSVGKMPTKAVSAMDGAGTGGDQQGASLIFLEYAR